MSWKKKGNQQSREDCVKAVINDNVLDWRTARCNEKLEGVICEDQQKYPCNIKPGTTYYFGIFLIHNK